MCLDAVLQTKREYNDMSADSTMYMQGIRSRLIHGDVLKKTYLRNVPKIKYRNRN